MFFRNPFFSDFFYPMARPTTRFMRRPRYNSYNSPSYIYYEEVVEAKPEAERGAKTDNVQQAKEGETQAKTDSQTQQQMKTGSEKTKQNGFHRVKYTYSGSTNWEDGEPKIREKYEIETPEMQWRAERKPETGGKFVTETKRLGEESSKQIGEGTNKEAATTEKEGSRDLSAQQELSPDVMHRNMDKLFRRFEREFDEMMEDMHEFGFGQAPFRGRSRRYRSPFEDLEKYLDEFESFAREDRFLENRESKRASEGKMASEAKSASEGKAENKAESKTDKMTSDKQQEEKPLGEAKDGEESAQKRPTQKV